MTHHHSQSEHEHQRPPKKGFHQDWRLWVAVLLMLAGMLVYLTSDDESIQPAPPPSEQVPAAAE